MKITWKIWLLFIFIIFALISIFSIPPTFLEKGVVVKYVEKNSTIFDKGLRQNMIITQINDQIINNMQDYAKAMAIFSDNKTHRLDITAGSLSIVDLFSPDIISQIEVSNIPKTRIRAGLDIQGGVRALVTAENISLTDSQLDDLISVSQERLNVYGLSDLVLTKASDLSGNKFMRIEISGSTPSDLESLISQQGIFEAKIGNQTVFTGGSQDITYVGRTGQDAGIYDCYTNAGEDSCQFRFTIYLSEVAAQRHADITKDMPLNITSGGQYLEKQIDFYLDGKLTESLNIGADLKGKVATQIQITGFGKGADRNSAIKDSQDQMKKLQTILITGSLPFKLKIVKIDKISPFLGEQFTTTILIASLCAALGVSVIIFLRYRRIKISLLILSVAFSEILMILGFATLMKANLDLASIAGIIATIGTGVDDQIIIVDETKRGLHQTVKERIKNALFIIFTAYATAVAALFPLFWAGAGLLKGFAFTTLVGITAGVFITRPAFADIIRQMEE